MYSRKNSEGLFTLWSDTQRNMWDNLFGVLERQSFSRGAQAASLWQTSISAWKHSVYTTLDASRASVDILSGSATPSTEASRAWQQQLETLRRELDDRMTQTMTLTPGMSASLSKTITEADITAFAQVSGDINPLHLNEAYAEKTRFGGRIAHGILSAGLISAVIGTRMPGPGAIYLSQTLKFRGPVSIGDEVTATVTVLSAHESKPIYTLETICTNEHGERVLEGEAVILYDPVTA